MITASLLGLTPVVTAVEAELAWDWAVAKDGAHNFRTYLWNGRRYDEALVIQGAAQ